MPCQTALTSSISFFLETHIEFRAVLAQLYSDMQFVIEFRFPRLGKLFCINQHFNAKPFNGFCFKKIVFILFLYKILKTVDMLGIHVFHCQKFKESSCENYCPKKPN